ncbi:MAG: Firmicu-CTERM sorting domain-containing protein [Eubacterium sp.]|nr:Firmicu-CTERM sorting domain-containing protein [Eubacterium sp.]
MRRGRLKKKLIGMSLVAAFAAVAVANQAQASSEDAITGITIDQDASEWKGIEKVDVSGDLSTGYNGLVSTALLQDDDYIYIYMEDKGNGDATWSGLNSNGQFSFVSDLGRTSLFQLKLQNGKALVNGLDGAEASYQYREWSQGGRSTGIWEIKIPTSALPELKSTYSFGYYQCKDRFIENIVDTRTKEGDSQEAGTDTQTSDAEIVYDGLYGDWKNYPHSRIDYATAGTNEGVVDGEAALYFGDTLYCHCLTTMESQIANKGRGLLNNVTLRVNQDDSKSMMFRFVTVDEAGNINWNPSTSDLANGDYEYYMVDMTGWSSAKTVDELKSQGNDLFGRMKVTIKDSSEECEFKLNMEALSDKFNLDLTDMQTFEVNFGAIGNQYVQTAGASTGPWTGIAMLILIATGGYMTYKSKNAEKKVRPMEA